ncbi:MAG: hypothetical protein RL410_1426, partial [Actinomycetota bacterium]
MTHRDYPRTPRLDLIETIHGREVADPYRWLEDAASDETIAWSKAQNELFEAERTTWTTHHHWSERVAQLLGGGMVSVPSWRGDRQFFMRRMPGEEMASLFTIDPDGVEHLLINPVALDPSGTTTLDSWQPSKEGNLLAYQLSVGGSEEASLYIMDVATGKNIDGPIDRARYSPVAW